MEGEHRTERGSPGPPFTRDEGQLPATCLVVRMRHWELRVNPLPFPVAGNRTVTLAPPAFLHTNPQGPVTLASRFFSSALLRHRLPCSPAPALRNGVTGTCSLGT